MAAKNDILIDKDGNQIFPATTAEQVSFDGNINVKQAIKRGAVRNKVAPTAASMTDKEQIYVYTGTEDGYTFGNWYYWDGTAWTSGGAYNAIEVNTDGTLTEEGAPADAKATGDKLSKLKYDLSNKVGWAKVTGSTLYLYADKAMTSLIQTVTLPSGGSGGGLADGNTTYTFAISGNVITVTDSDGGEQTITLPSAVTDSHINSLIDAKLGVIENGTY